jgi:probable aminopeptidase NPEPL1
VEINNTDAEGRLVLGDGVALASGCGGGLPRPGPRAADLIVNMATLTGAQLVTTGKTVAAVMSNKAGAETRAVAAGAHSGDLCFPVKKISEWASEQ